jgi:hypothetical protein
VGQRRIRARELDPRRFLRLKGRARLEDELQLVVHLRGAQRKGEASGQERARGEPADEQRAPAPSSSS